MCSAFRCRNIIYKPIRIICKGIVVLHCYLHDHVIFCSLTVNNILVKRCLALIQIFDKFFDTSLVMERIFLPIFFPEIFQTDLKTLGKKCHFTETLFQNIILKNRIFKNRVIWKEGYFCSADCRITFTNYFKWIHDLSFFVALFINLSFTADFNFQPVGKCVYNRSTYSMKSSGYFVSSTTKLSTCMKDSKYDFYCRKSCFVIDSDRNTTPVIYNRN